MKKTNPNERSSRQSLWLLPLTAVFTILIAAGVISGAIWLGNRGESGGDPSQAGTATPTPFDTPVLQLAPKTGRAGTSITVRGQNWPANDTIFIGLENPADAEVEPLALENVNTDAQGQFMISVDYPPERYWNNLPVVLITAESESTGVRTAESFRIGGVATGTPSP